VFGCRRADQQRPANAELVETLAQSCAGAGAERQPHGEQLELESRQCERRRTR
jgi:hypothetical protein